MKHTTIKDIAKHLNVSVSTVSRAFNDKYDIRPETRDLILETAKELGYSPNPIARKLVQQKSFNIGMIVPEFENSFFPQIIMGAQSVLHEHNYQVLVMQSNEDAETELSNARTLVGNMVDGLIISITSEDQNVEYYQELLQKKLPIVFFNRVPAELNTSKVLFDDYKWAFFATEHLINQGLKNIIHLAYPHNLSFAKDRIKGFKDAHKKYKLPEGKTITCGFTIEEGERIAEQLINNGEIPEAIFSSGDYSAIGVMKAFKRHGYKIPEDIRVVGFSESQLAQHVDPPLTSVSQPTDLMGQAAAELLLGQINNKGIIVPQTIVLNGRLNVRESSVKVI